MDVRKILIPCLTANAIFTVVLTAIVGCADYKVREMTKDLEASTQQRKQQSERDLANLKQDLDRRYKVFTAETDKMEQEFKDKCEKIVINYKLDTMKFQLALSRHAANPELPLSDLESSPQVNYKRIDFRDYKNQEVIFLLDLGKDGVKDVVYTRDGKWKVKSEVSVDRFSDSREMSSSEISELESISKDY